MTWYRCRFHANPDDYRPVTFPPPGPYWCSGSGDGYSIVIAYFEDPERITEFWPEATEIDVDDGCDTMLFTDRFPKPEWWDETTSND